jgi:hypothetical protein
MVNILSILIIGTNRSIGHDTFPGVERISGTKIRLEGSGKDALGFAALRCSKNV